ncbi:hypothetical protein GCM10020256_07950 [Streptomyces thermocoprophilus]
MTRGESAEEVVELCDRALVNGRLAPGLGWTDTEWGAELLMMLGSAYAYADRLDRAESLFAEALRAYTLVGWSGGHLALANAYLGLAYRRQGRLKDAENVLRDSLRLAERVGRGLPLYWSAVCGLVDTLLARGRVEEAWSMAEQYGFHPPYPSTIVLPDPQSVRGRLLLAVGRTKEGIDELQAAEKSAASRGHHNPVMVAWALDLARALATEEPSRAAQLVFDARRRAERFGTDTAIGEAPALRRRTGDRAARRPPRRAGRRLPGVLALPVRARRGPRRVRDRRPLGRRTAPRPRSGPRLRRRRPRGPGPPRPGGRPRPDLMPPVTSARTLARSRRRAPAPRDGSRAVRHPAVRDGAVRHRGPSLRAPPPAPPTPGRRRSASAGPPAS